VTGSFVAGFVQGFVLFLSLPLRLGVPFGGFTEIGGMVAVGLWLYLLHVLVLVGFLLTLRIDARGGVPWHRPDDVRRVPAGRGGCVYDHQPTSLTAAATGGRGRPARPHR
jgi:membrane protein